MKIGLIAVLAMAANAAICGMMALCDDTFDINEAFGYGPHDQVGGAG